MVTITNTFIVYVLSKSYRAFESPTSHTTRFFSKSRFQLTTTSQVKASFSLFSPPLYCIIIIKNPPLLWPPEWVQLWHTPQVRQQDLTQNLCLLILLCYLVYQRLPITKDKTRLTANHNVFTCHLIGQGSFFYWLLFSLF